MMSLSKTLTFVTLLTFLSPSQALLHHSTEQSDVEVISNPHDISEKNTNGNNGICASDDTSSSCQPHLLLAPHFIITKPKVTQPDTLESISHHKILSVPVPIYKFRQPARLSSLQLPFNLILVKDIPVDGQSSIVEVPVDLMESSDSWFPGYRWIPIMCTEQCPGEEIHVGWKFQSLIDDGDYFYALIVQIKKKERDDAGVVGIVDRVADILTVGVRAPEWMIDSIAKMW
eukprot:CAMPEP_0172498524 /NCGR_PEP_ID=MMETSP1066-20121228/113486_1 /TAXON_ID=671091 /ORGANISM="Coscinodiscus wailesii, Strain CCMP2513" /LENGTH=229 /DNA_ID=CAMNT_0013271821 /DNA_START=85 /DNA_END=774 /DNA_ORIENTATION=-